MRMVVVVGASLIALVGSGWADEIYRWTDAAGHVHYSNTPTSGGRAAAVTDDGDEAPPAGESAGRGDGSDAHHAAADDADRESFSTTASLRRNALEHEMRTTDRRLHELDGRLAGLARARTANAGGSAATGGVGTAALDVRSDEERALAEERDRVAGQMQELQGSYGKLREEVATRLGGVPPWWVEVRAGR